MDWTLKLAARLRISREEAARLMSDAEADLHAACDSEEEASELTQEDIYQLAADRNV